ncbi:MAG: cobalamin-binding protein [Spirochaetales bacterium]|nr:cobalamin-binding protein [Spirochaetales bacterium]
MKKLLFSFFAFCFVFCAASSFAFGKREAAKFADAVPQRIVSLSPAATEILFAVGAENQIVARTNLCNYPPEAQKLPAVGGFDGKLFSLENIISFKPDFVYLTEGMHDHLVEPLTAYGIKVYVSKAQSLDDVLGEIQTIAEITGHKENGAKCVASIKDEFRQAQEESKKLAAHKPSVYWEIWNAPYMSIGNDSFLNEIIEVAGLENIFGALKQKYPVVSEESIIAAGPEMILYASDAPLSKDDFLKRGSWKNIPAIKNGRIYQIDADLMTRPGPRVGKAALALSALAKEAFEGR